MVNIFWHPVHQVVDKHVGKIALEIAQAAYTAQWASWFLKTERSLIRQKRDSDAVVAAAKKRYTATLASAPRLSTEERRETMNAIDMSARPRKRMRRAGGGGGGGGSSSSSTPMLPPFEHLVEQGLAYRPAHRFHPIVSWMIGAREHYLAACTYGLKLCAEHTYRHGSIHACERHLEWLNLQPPALLGRPASWALSPAATKKAEEVAFATGTGIPTWLRTMGVTRVPLCMPEHCYVRATKKGDKRDGHDLLRSYQQYYVREKAAIASWTRREPPGWFAVAASSSSLAAEEASGAASSGDSSGPAAAASVEGEGRSPRGQQKARPPRRRSAKTKGGSSSTRSTSKRARRGTRESRK